MADLTSNNAVIIFSVPGLLPTPTQIQGFSADDIFDNEEIDAVEATIGVDGILSGAVINAAIPQTFTLQADSPSMNFFDSWYWGQRTNKTVYFAQGIVTLTSVGTSWACVQGLLQRFKAFPDAKKKLEPRKFRILWQSTLPTPIGSGG
jgi:hypothetical protein